MSGYFLSPSAQDDLTDIADYPPNFWIEKDFNLIVYIGDKN